MHPTKTRLESSCHSLEARQTRLQVDEQASISPEPERHLLLQNRHCSLHSKSKAWRYHARPSPAGSSLAPFTDRDSSPSRGKSSIQGRTRRVCGPSTPLLSWPARG